MKIEFGFGNQVTHWEGTIVSHNTLLSLYIYDSTKRIKRIMTINSLIRDTKKNNHTNKYV